MINAALVLEGGALRSLYTAGVLDVFMENKIEFKCVIGVSAGALCGANYIAKHIGNSAKINIIHSGDSNFVGLRQLIVKGSIFNFNYLFYDPIKKLYPYDEERLKNSKQKFLIGATDCRTGNVVYFERNNYDDLVHALQASSSMPLLSKIVNIDGMECLDGAIADPISLHKAFSEGYNKVIIILTRDSDYRKQDPSSLHKLLFKVYEKKYPKLIATMRKRPHYYNLLMEEINSLEKNKKS